MKKVGIAVYLSVGFLLVGCPRVESPTDTTNAPLPEATTPISESESVSAKPGPKPEAAAPAYSADQTAAARQWVTDLGVAIKEDADGNVIEIDTAKNRSWVTNAQMEVILAFPKLKSLTLEGPDITDELAPRIAQQTTLTSLAFRNTLIGDKGIAQFTTLKSLKVIDLRVSPYVGDASMETLAKLPELRAVRLTGVVKVTDAGIGTLLTLPRLSELDIRNCREITKAGIDQLAKKDTLRTLKVGGPEVRVGRGPRGPFAP